MDGEASIRTEGTVRWWSVVFWAVMAAGLIGWQATLSLKLFGADGWAAMQSDEPILSGAHPQNLYFGALGAQGLRTNGTTCVYDPAFQVGYPKTPIFDGSRLAEVFLFLVGDLPPALAYKLGVALMCLAVPIFMLIAAWGAGLDAVAAGIATALGIVIWWGPHGRDAIEAGNSEMLIASLTVLCHICLLIRFDRSPGVATWLGLVMTAGLGTLAQPMLFPVVLPLVLVYYLSAGPKHAMPWHFALATAEAAALAINLFWLTDWFSYWWLRSPLPSPSELLPHRTLATFWNAPIWGGPGHRLLALMLLGSGIVGVGIWTAKGQAASARLLTLGGAGMLILALLGISWEPLGQMGTSILLTPALWFAAIPAASGWVWIVSRLTRSTAGRLGLLAVVGAALAAGSLVRAELAAIAHRVVAVDPLSIGLDSRRQDLVATLRQYTSADGRILWEDRKLPRKASRWSVLLPWLTERVFLGGLDPAGTIEHSSISFIDETLEGRHISLWSDRSLDDYCRRYNVHWIVAWSRPVIERLSAWPGVDRRIPVRDDVEGALFLLKTPGPGYVTRGKAQVVVMNSEHIVLADVVPEGGEVVLNLHYLAGLRAAPSRVAVEREPCGHDPIGFIRLRMTSPVPRLTLTWDRQR